MYPNLHDRVAKFWDRRICKSRVQSLHLWIEASSYHPSSAKLGAFYDSANCDLYWMISLSGSSLIPLMNEVSLTALEQQSFVEYPADCCRT